MNMVLIDAMNRLRISSRVLSVASVSACVASFRFDQTSSVRADDSHGLLLCPAHCEGQRVDSRRISHSSDQSLSSSSIFPQGNSDNIKVESAKGGAPVSPVPCEAYNSLWNRLQWAERRNRCCAQSGCVFLGRSITGSCTPVDASIRSRGGVGSSQNDPGIEEEELPVSEKELQDNPKEAENAIVKLYVEIANEKSTEPIKILLRNSISASAVDSLRGSQQLANELSKKMILNYLNNGENIKITTDFASGLMIDPQIQASIRLQVYELLLSTQPRRYIFQLAFSTKDYYIHPYGAGRTECLSSLVYLLDWWFREDSTRKQVVVPLAVWALLLEESTKTPAAELAAWALPAAQESTNQALTDLAVSYLESEETKKLAKDGIVSLLTSLRL